MGENIYIFYYFISLTFRISEGGIAVTPTFKVRELVFMLFSPP